MRTKRAVAVASVFSMLLATATFAQDGIAVTPISCVAPNMNARVVARAAASTRSARTYFTAFPGQPEYYLDMHLASDGSYWAVLPQVEPATKSFSYRVVTIDANGKQTSSPAMTATATSTCALTLSAEEQQFASNLAIGKTNDTQSSIAAGFTCRGQVSVITASGQLKPNDECRRILAAAGAADKGRMSAFAIGAIVVGAGAAAAIIIKNNQKDNVVISRATP